MTSKANQYSRAARCRGRRPASSSIADYQSSDLPLMSKNFFQYMGFMPAPGPGWKSSFFDFDHDYKRLACWTRSTPVQSRPAKVLRTRGASSSWARLGRRHHPSLNTIDYYETVERTMEVSPRHKGFFRLFMMPGVDHCWGGEGASVVDFLSYMEAWGREKPGARHDNECPFKAVLTPDLLPTDPALIGFTRPVYPYPLQASTRGLVTPIRPKTSDQSSLECCSPAVWAPASFVAIFCLGCRAIW